LKLRFRSNTPTLEKSWENVEEKTVFFFLKINIFVGKNEIIIFPFWQINTNDFSNVQYNTAAASPCKPIIHFPFFSTYFTVFFPRFILVMALRYSQFYFAQMKFIEEFCSKIWTMDLLLLGNKVTAIYVPFAS